MQYLNKALQIDPENVDALVARGALWVVWSDVIKMSFDCWSQKWFHLYGTSRYFIDICIYEMYIYIYGSGYESAAALLLDIKTRWQDSHTILTWPIYRYILLTHWGRVTHLCVDKSTIIGSDNGLSPERRQAITWANVGILLIGLLGTNISEILSGIQTFSFKKMHLRMPSAKWRAFRLGLNVLTVV